MSTRKTRCRSNLKSRSDGAEDCILILHELSYFKSLITVDTSRKAKPRYVSASPSISPEIIWSIQRSLEFQSFSETDQSILFPSTIGKDHLLQKCQWFFTSLTAHTFKNTSSNEAVQTTWPYTKNGWGHFYLMALTHQGDPFLSIATFQLSVRPVQGLTVLTRSMIGKWWLIIGLDRKWDWFESETWEFFGWAANFIGLVFNYWSVIGDLTYLLPWHYYLIIFLYTRKLLCSCYLILLCHKILYWSSC